MVEYHGWDETNVQEEVYSTAKGRFELLRETQQEIENFLFGAEPEWPWRAPVIRSLEFEDEEHGFDSASAAGMSGDTQVLSTMLMSSSLRLTCHSI